MKFIHRGRIHSVEKSHGIQWDDHVYTILGERKFYNVHVITNVRNQLTRIMEVI